MRYNKKNISNLKGKIINITLASLLLASVPYIYIAASGNMNTNNNEAQTEISDKINNSEDKDNVIDIDDTNKETEDTETPSNPNISKDKDIDNSMDSSDIDNNQVENETSDKSDNLNGQASYIVNHGDTLFKISDQYNITVKQLKYMNGLTNDIIYIGQTLNVSNKQISITDSKLVPNPDDIWALINKQNYLPDDYVPRNLVVPNISFPFKEFHSKKLMRQDAASALEELFKKAKQDNINLFAVSGYRSYETQKAIFTSNVKKHGLERANQFSAKPGESEHQTGLAMDITSKSINFSLTQYFGETKEGKWIKAHAHKFGFIIRYPKGKEEITGYQYEPWHIRYVGKDAAKDITNENITLEEYLDK